MRLRNITGAQTLVEQSDFVIMNPKEHKNSWPSLFKNDHPIHIEIGMGKGNFIIENAIQNPNINYIGIEKYYSVLVKAINRLENYNLPNLKIIVFDANQIEEIFSNEIDTIYLNFSDPWPKKRHARRRLTSPEFLNKYECLFQNHPHIVMKTDNRKLFEYSVQTFVASSYQIADISLNLYEDNYENNISTEYEQKFSSKGYPIYKIDVVKS